VRKTQEKPKQIGNTVKNREQIRRGLKKNITEPKGERKREKNTCNLGEAPRSTRRTGLKGLSDNETEIRRIQEISTTNRTRRIKRREEGRTSKERISLNRIGETGSSSMCWTSEGRRSAGPAGKHHNRGNTKGTKTSQQAKRKVTMSTI
jgi:hypothetical protein